MNTVIYHIGNPTKAQGRPSIEELVAVIRSPECPLSLHLAGPFGCWSRNDVENRGFTRFIGNFETVSLGFDFTTNDPDVIEMMNEAIRQNKSYTTAQTHWRMKNGCN